MAWIERRGDVWTVCYREHGKRQRTRGLPSERAAQAVADEIDRVHARGQVYVREGRAAPRWDEVAAGYVTWGSARQAASTMQSVASSLDRFGTWAAARTRRREVWCDEIDVETLEDWHADMLAEPVAASYARQCVTRVRRALAWAADRPDWRRTFTAPPMPRLPTADTLVGSESPSWEDCDRAISCATGWVRQLMVLGRATGLRCSQLMHLRREHLDRATATLYIPPRLPGSKTKSERRGRWVPVPPWLVDEVATWGPWDGWLVDKGQRVRANGPRARDDVRRPHGRSLVVPWVAAGVHVEQPTHALRKAHYTGLLLAGVPDAHVDALQGRSARTLGGSTYADWRRLVEPVLRPAVALVPPIRYDLPPVERIGAGAPTLPPTTRTARRINAG